MTPPLEPEAEQELLRLVRWRVRRWRGHAEYPDMLAESYLKAWQSYRQATLRGLRSPLAIAVHGAGYGPYAWLRRWYGTQGRSGRIRPAIGIPLEEAGELPGRSAEELAIVRLEAFAVWERLMRRSTPRQREVLRRLFLDGETVSEVAATLKVLPADVSRIRDRALAWLSSGSEIPTTFPPRLESYSRCPAGHPLIPENLTPVRRQGKVIRQRCRLCAKLAMRAKRRKARPAPQEAAGTASAPLADLGHPHAENGGEIGS